MNAQINRWRWVDCTPHESYFERHAEGPWVKYADVDERSAAPTPLAGATKPNEMNPAAPASLESGLVGVTMELEDAIPEGWALSTADFSMRAGEGPTSRRTGWVSLSRTGLNRKAWLELREAEREATPLYVSGVGRTLRAAILDAVATLRALPGEPT